jgi:dimethylhistidine N-methyltransferase
MNTAPAMRPSIIPVTHLAPGADDFRADVLRGLSVLPKTLPCKYFYDEAGSRLFERICELPEYYLTRVELELLRRHSAEIAALLGRDCLLIEYGSGSSLKTRRLLDHLRAPVAYVPIDIAYQQLSDSATALASDYPQLAVRPVCADFTRLSVMPAIDVSCARRVVYFPGSTIGNFTPQQARQLLEQTANLCGPGGALLLGVDLKKDPRILEAAYNDSRRVTAAFNLNLLVRINRELDANFCVEQFRHYAPYNPRESRIEMHLVSRRDQHVRVGDRKFFLRQGESICTEYSHKYSLHDLRDLAQSAGFAVERLWIDEHGYFSVQYLVVR